MPTASIESTAAARAIRIHMVFFGTAAAVWFASAAHADVAPPSGYVEHCTVERTCPVGQECVLCSEDYSDNAACARKLEPLGFAKQCKSAGASVWSEVWCRPASGARDANVPSESFDGSVGQLMSDLTVCREQEGCSCRAVGARSQHHTGVGLGLVSLGLAWFVRRRKSGRN